jgi:hypothetical protein
MIKGHYTTPQKKPVKPHVRMKAVRIDHRTIVEVPAGMSDEDAIERYYDKHKSAIRPNLGVLLDDEIPQEELAAAFIDEEKLPEE